jgi:hypothetical protein
VRTVSHVLTRQDPSEQTGHWALPTWGRSCWTRWHRGRARGRALRPGAQGAHYIEFVELVKSNPFEAGAEDGGRGQARENVLQSCRCKLSVSTLKAAATLLLPAGCVDADNVCGYVPTSQHTRSCTNAEGDASTAGGSRSGHDSGETARFRRE